MPQLTPKITELINGYNKEMRQANEMLTDPQYRDYKPDVLKQKSQEKKFDIIKGYKAKIEEFKNETGSSYDSLLTTKMSKLFPNVTGDNNKTAGEMQLQAAKSLLASKDNIQILNELKKAFYMKRTDFVSAILNELLAGVNLNDWSVDLMGSEKANFIKEVAKIKDAHYKNVNLHNFDKDMRDVKNAQYKVSKFDAALDRSKEWVDVSDFGASATFEDERQKMDDDFIFTV